MLKTVKSKFIFFSLFLILISVGAPTTFLIMQLRENFRQRSVVMLETTMEVLYNGLNSAMMQGNQKNIQHILDNLASNKSIDHIRIYSKSGSILYSSEPDEVGRVLWNVSPGHERLDHKVEDRFYTLDHETDTYILFQPIHNTEACRACHQENSDLGYLDVDTKLTRAETNFFTGSVHIIFLGLVTALILIAGNFLIFNRYVNNPLRSFTSALESVRSGNLQTRLNAKSDDEFGVIYTHFNQMVDKLNKSSQQIETLHFEQLKRADKMVTLGELAAEMAHEINNPVGIIQSQADFLRLELKRTMNNNDLEEEFNTIAKQVDKISQITKNILRYGKKLPIDFHAFDVKAPINNVIEILMPRLKHNSIQLQTSLPDRDAIIYGDPIQIEQVLTNLINNAIDAIEDGGTIKLDLKIEDEHIFALSVADNGTGMDEQMLENIFAPFYTTKPQSRGTGLGLYIVKNICKNHQAEIDCQSKPGKGTTFTIRFKGMDIEKNIDR